MKIPIYESEAVPTKETGQSFTIPGQRQVAFEVPKTKEVADLAMSKVGDVLVDIAEKIREANDVDELNKLKSKTLEGYTTSTNEIEQPEFQNKNPRLEGEDTMSYYERHRSSRANVIKDKVLTDFNGSTRARKRAENIVSDYDAYNSASITSFARAKKIEEMEFSLGQSMDSNSRAAIQAYASGDLNTYGEAIKNARTAIESNIAAGIVSGPRGEAMLKSFESDVAVGVQSAQIDKAYTTDLANMDHTKDVPNALMGILSYIDKGEDPYLQDPKVRANMRNLVEAKISNYDVKYEKHMREVREVYEIELRQNLEKNIDTAVQKSMEGDTNAYYRMLNNMRASLGSAVENKVLSASQAYSIGEYYQKEAAFAVHGRTIDNYRETGNKVELQKLMDKFSAAPNKDTDPYLDEPIKRALYNQAASALEHTDRRNSTKDYIAEGEVKRMLENAKMDARKNGKEPDMKAVETKIRSAFQNQDRATAIYQDFEYDMKGENAIYKPLNEALKGGPAEEAKVLGELDAKVTAGGDQSVHAVQAQQTVSNAILQKREAVNKDALTYVNTVFDLPPQSFVKDMVDKKPFSPVDAEMLLQRQREIGATPNQERLLSKSDADRLVSNILTAKGEEGLMYLQSLKNHFGDYWNVVNRDLMKSKMPNEFHIASSLPPGPDGRPSRDAVLLINTSKMNKDQVAETLGYENAKSLNKQLYIGLQETDEYKEMRRSLRLQGVDVENNKQLTDLKDSIHNLAVGYMDTDKKSENRAVEDAAKVIIGDSYNFAKEGFRIPKQYNQDIIVRSTRFIKDNYNTDMLPQTTRPRTEEDKRIAAQRIRRDGFFVNDETGNGLILLSSQRNVAVMNADGTPRVFTWDELMKGTRNFTDYKSVVESE